MTDTPQYDHFKQLTDSQYRYCTLQEKLAVYQQHHPSMITALLEELVRAVYPEWTTRKKPDVKDPPTTAD